ncbi:MAG: hypothetical protein JKY15_08905 [Deltaproteobacteria bacterium]|nr:hypothetical protein [Deltaproteobacteria bacterium]
MIKSAEEFVRLRTSEILEESDRAVWEEAEITVWKQVIADYPDMRKWVAHNKSIPDEIIRMLVFDEDWSVRHTIARKRKTPPDVLVILAKDIDEGVRRLVSVHRKTPAGILEMMLNDECPEIVGIARERLAELQG